LEGQVCGLHRRKGVSSTPERGGKRFAVFRPTNGIAAKARLCCLCGSLARRDAFKADAAQAFGWSPSRRAC